MAVKDERGLDSEPGIAMNLAYLAICGGAPLSFLFAMATGMDTNYAENKAYAEQDICPAIAQETRIPPEIQDGFVAHCADTTAYKYFTDLAENTGLGPYFTIQTISGYKEAYPEEWAQFKDVMEGEARQWKNYHESIDKITSRLQEIVIDNTRPFTNASIDFELQSLFPLVSEKGETTSTYTGKFTVTITDPGSNASRDFSYDHGTGNIMHVNGTTSGTFNFQWEGRWSGLLSAGMSSGEGNGSVGFRHTGPANCNDEQRSACIIVDTVLQAINTELSKNELTRLNEIIAQTANRKEDELNYRIQHARGHSVKDEVYKQAPVWQPKF